MHMRHDDVDNSIVKWSKNIIASFSMGSAAHDTL